MKHFYINETILYKRLGINFSYYGSAAGHEYPYLTGCPKIQFQGKNMEKNKAFKAFKLKKKELIYC
jgi:hypothetical protein